MKRKNRSSFLFILILIIAAISFLPNAFANDALSNLQKEEDFIKNLYDQDKQSVVQIRVELDPAKISENNNNQDQNTNPPKKFIPPILKEDIHVEPNLVQSYSTGTGFIITPDGEILTNYHVIEAYKEIEVRLSTGAIFKANVVGFDKNSDVALLKIRMGKKINLPVLALGDSNSIFVTQKIMVIGHPFSLSWTPSLGNISGLERNADVGQPTLTQIQTSVNPGNSGSPLITILDNKVVGIVNGKVANGENIGFAIPINSVKSLLSQLRSSQKIVPKEGP